MVLKNIIIILQSIIQKDSYSEKIVLIQIQLKAIGRLLNSMSQKMADYAENMVSLFAASYKCNFSLIAVIKKLIY